MPIIIDEKELMKEIKKLLEEIKNKIEVERMVSHTYHEAMRGMNYDINDGPDAYAKLWIDSVYPIMKQLKDLEKKSDINELILIKHELNKIKQEIDVKGQEYNWRNARKYKNPNNPELLEEIVKIKSKYFINKSNQLSEELSHKQNGSKKAKCTII